jgi:hypothetical protein
LILRHFAAHEIVPFACPQTEGLGQGCRRFVAEPANLLPNLPFRAIEKSTSLQRKM